MNNAYKERLEKELAEVTEELRGIGRVNPDNPKDWEATTAGTGMENDAADSNVMADKFEEFDNNNAMLAQLESRYNDLKSAIARIDAETFGKCEVCGKDIEEDRLNANPAAATCKEHIDQ